MELKLRERKRNACEGKEKEKERKAFAGSMKVGSVEHCALAFPPSNLVLWKLLLKHLAHWVQRFGPIP